MIRRDETDLRRRQLATLASLWLIASAAGCGHSSREYMWVDVVPKSMLAPESGYRISPGDVISVRVWNQDANSVDRVRVREDGKITIPFLDDVEVAGSEPAELARRLETKLRPFIQKPIVTIVVNERRPMRVSILGQVVKPGTYDLDEDAGVLQGLAAAGGTTPFAERDGIFVLRRGYWADDPSATACIRFRYADLKRGAAPAAAFRLRRGDVLVVE